MLLKLSPGNVKIRFIFFAAGCLLLLSGCGTLGTYNAATGRREFVPISTSTEISLGQQVHSELSNKYRIDDTSPQLQRLRRIGRRIANVSDRQDYTYQFYIIDQDELNAFTTPGGNIYMYRGLMERLKTDDRIAGVVAHEVGHCAARHVAKKYSATLGYNVLGSMIFNSIEEMRAREVTALSSGIIMNLIFSAYSRQDEYSADRLAVKYMYLAGYDVQGFVETLYILEQESESTPGLLMLRSHPYLSDRIKGVQEKILLVQEKYGKPG
jgi:predicted Zn-dependent protease